MHIQPIPDLFLSERTTFVFTTFPGEMPVKSFSQELDKNYRQTSTQCILADLTYTLRKLRVQAEGNEIPFRLASSEQLDLTSLLCEGD